MEAVTKALKEMEENDVIEEVKDEPTPWISEMVMVPKPNDPSAVRITLDSKPINQAIQRERHNTAMVEDLAIDLNRAKYKSKLDLKRGYHQIVIHRSSRYITTFRTPLGLRRYKRLVMGICSAAEIFQNIIEKVLDGLAGAKNLVDDIFVYGSTLEEHDERLHAVLKRLEDKGLTLSPDKCELRKTEIEFFGLKFTTEGIALTDEKIRALKEASLPKTQSELRSFLGLASYCSRSIPNFASISHLLWRMTRKKIDAFGNKAKGNNAILKWSDDEIGQFNQVKSAVMSDALGYFNKEWDTSLEVDASPTGAGGVLFQNRSKGQRNKKDNMLLVTGFFRH